MFRGGIHMRIEIEYLQKDSDASKKISLLPEDYFDPLEDGEFFERDGIPRFNHDAEYISISNSRLVWSKLTIQGTDDDRTIVTNYYCDGETWMTHRIDPNGYEEIIHNTKIDRGTWHIIRTHKKKDGAWKVILNSVIYDLPDGSEREVRFDSPTIKL